MAIDFHRERQKRCKLPKIINSDFPSKRLKAEKRCGRRFLGNFAGHWLITRESNCYMSKYRPK